MLPKTISIGPLDIHLYGVVIALAIYLSWALAKKRASLYKIPLRIFEDPVLLIPLVLALIGARAYHVLDLWSTYQQNLPQIFAISSGGLGIWGALGGVFFGFWLVAKIKRIDFLSLLDLMSPSLILGQSLGRIGNYINQEGFGPPTNLPWGLYISPENRPLQFGSASHFHPTFFYEAALDAIFFAVLIFLEKKRHSGERSDSRIKKRFWTGPSAALRAGQNDKNNKGQVFALYLILYSTGRFVAEFWRIDTWTIEVVKVAHLLSVITFIGGVWLLFYLKKKRI